MSTLSINITNPNDNLFAVENLYARILTAPTESFNNPLIIELEGHYRKIVSSFPSITEDQIFVIQSIFDKFRFVQEVIDPNRLKDFSFAMSEDEDIILFRNSENDIINLVIHPEEDFSLSIINKTAGSSIEYFDNESADFEKVVYSFLR